jgi:hypothetical protein
MHEPDVKLKKKKKLIKSLRFGLIYLILVGGFLVTAVMLGLHFSRDEEPNHRLLTMDELLYDFDYMIERLVDTSPHFGVIQRRLGLDVMAVAAETRGLIENYPQSLPQIREIIINSGMPEAAINIFLLTIEPMDFAPYINQFIFHHIVQGTFFWRFSNFDATIGHMSLVPLSRFVRERPGVRSRGYSFDFFSAEASLILNRWTLGATNRLAFSSEYARTYYLELNNFLMEREIIHSSAFDIDTEAESEPILSMSILEEGRIAYITLYTFGLNDTTSDLVSELFEFYREIQDYEHLVIDIRGNHGGFMELWMYGVVYPLTEIREDDTYYAFYLDTFPARNLAFMHLRERLLASNFTPETRAITSALLPLDALLETSYLPYLNEDDSQAFWRGARLVSDINNLRFMSEWVLVNYTNISSLSDIPSYPFGGQIWLLTDVGNASASAHFAHFAKEAEFAILVGDTVGGSYSTACMMFFTLPNTGIIAMWDISYVTDRYGRALDEFPTSPHFFNRDGLDALETVLQMIEEGAY